MEVGGLLWGVPGGGTLAPQWLDYQRLARAHSGDDYVFLMATTFLGLGIFVGCSRLWRQPPCCAIAASCLLATRSCRVSGASFFRAGAFFCFAKYASVVFLFLPKLEHGTHARLFFPARGRQLLLVILARRAILCPLPNGTLL